MHIEVRRFGSPARQMLGLLQRPLAGQARRPAFLMFRPYGQEAIRTAAIYRAMSDRLAREGCNVLTFDHHGCGDSPGNLDAQSLADWAKDTAAAHDQLQRDAPGLPVHWFGMCLGANIAAAAALKVASPPEHLLLWEPVVDGASYVERLTQVHRDEMAREMGRSWSELVRLGHEVEPSLPGNVLGFSMGKELHAELLQLQGLPTASIGHCVSRVVVALQESQHGALGIEKLEGVTLQTVESPTNWMSIEALDTAIVPQEIPRTLLATLQ